MQRRSVTIKDVAKLAGVSVGTASKAINNIYVRPEAKEKVDRAVAELNYVPNAMARGLKNQATRTIGVMIPDISRSVNNRVLRGISDACMKANYSMMVSDFNLSEETLLIILQTFIEKQVDGMIYASNAISPKLRDALVASRIPMVLIMTTAGDEKFPRLTIDNEEAARHMTRRLLDLGHRDILFLSGEREDYNAGAPRLNGFCKAFEELGIPVKEELINEGVFEFSRGYEDVIVALEKQIPFTAIFCGADLVAMGAIKALKERGYRIPDDISVAGFDGIDASRYIVPELTTIQQPFRDFGEESVKLLVRMIEEEIPGENKTLEWKVQEGGTIGPCKQISPEA